MKVNEKNERDANLASFIEIFEKTFGHKPSYRRTKSGLFLFDEGLDTEFGVNACLLGRYSYFMEKEGKSALKHNRQIEVGDKEMEKLANLLNHPALGMRTNDCCFGHPEKDIAINHHSSSFVGFHMVNEEKYVNFWKLFFEKHRGKVKVCSHEDGLAQFSILAYDPVDGIMKSGKHILEISSWHNPAIRQEGIDEKKAAIRMLELFIEEYTMGKTI